MVTKVPESEPAVPQQQCKPEGTAPDFQALHTDADAFCTPAPSLSGRSGTCLPPARPQIWHRFHRTPHLRLTQDTAPQIWFDYSQSPAQQTMSCRELTWKYRQGTSTLPCRATAALEPSFAGDRREQAPIYFSLQLLFLPRKTARLVHWTELLFSTSAACLLNAGTVPCGNDITPSKFNKTLAETHFMSASFVNYET